MATEFVQIRVIGDCGHLLGTWQNRVEDKYPFWCDDCEEYKREGKYPWRLETEIVRA